MSFPLSVMFVTTGTPRLSVLCTKQSLSDSFATCFILSTDSLPSILTSNTKSVKYPSTLRSVCPRTVASRLSISRLSMTAIFAHCMRRHDPAPIRKKLSGVGPFPCPPLSGGSSISRVKFPLPLQTPESLDGRRVLGQLGSLPAFLTCRSSFCDSLCSFLFPARDFYLLSRRPNSRLGSNMFSEGPLNVESV